MILYVNHFIYLFISITKFKNNKIKRLYIFIYAFLSFRVIIVNLKKKNSQFK